MRRLILVGTSVALAGGALAACTQAEGSAPSENQAHARAVMQQSLLERTDSLARARQDSINRTLPGYVVDSILPVEEDLRRFRLAIRERSGANEDDDRLNALTSASESREALVRRFVKALASSDSSDLHAMHITAREFADLVYPESPYTHPPYRQSPALVWNQILMPSSSGLTRLLRRVAGEPLQYVDHSCSDKAERQGNNVLWVDCTLRLADPSGKKTHQNLFGSIIEREGRFKFVSYSNAF